MAEEAARDCSAHHKSQGLRQQLRDQERRANEGFFGSATSSAKRPVKANTSSVPEPRRKGARPWHRGVGRQVCDASQAERVVEVAAEVGARCPRRQTRAASVPQQVFGKSWLPGCLVVDRYSGYHKVPCAIQDCSSHLLREVHDLEQAVPDATAVTASVSTVAPQLILAMRLRAQPIEDAEFAQQAIALKAQLMASLEAPAQHLGIHRIQGIFRAHVDRLHQWVDDRRIPAENNLADRDRRPTAIAHKVSFGSQADTGAQTRGSLMSVLHTVKKRQVDVVAHLKAVLDQLALNSHHDPFPLLFPEAPT